MHGYGQAGFVTLNSSGGQTEVVLLANVGIPALALIHECSCQTLGGVAYGLSDTSKNMSSRTVTATLDSLMVGSLAVMVHNHR